MLPPTDPAAVPPRRDVRLTDESVLTLASARDAIVVFRRTNDRWHALRPRLDWDAAATAFAGGEDPAAARTARLGLVNCFQWHLEDACRAARHDPASVARLKAEIDRSNARRVRAVDEINLAVADDLRRSGAGAGPDPRIALATPGDLLDRLSILELKRCHALRRAELGLVDLLTDQVDDLCRGMDELVDDLLSSRVRMKLYRTVKLYGSAAGPGGSPRDPDGQP